ncbi:MAG TPA: FKBP-type peptidyl-prolyl cis-trans isomerase [Gemmatimonadales bacterium]|jgi:FKBP-type peptidyl-prolyl cis-trans isomerase
MVGPSVPRRGRTVLGGVVAVALLAGCVDPPGPTPCTPVAFDTAAVNGDTITTTTGLRFVEGTPGAGDTILVSCHAAIVHYTAYLLDGTKFDSSHDTDTPLVFTPGGGLLIDGFEQGVIGMRIGGTRRLIIPPDLGYGTEPVRDANGTIIIPANSTLVFDVELLGIVP